MADTKISALNAASALAGAEAIPGVQGGATVRITPAQLLAYVLGAAATTEAVQDIVGALLAGAGGITATYNDAGNVETISIDTTNAAFVEGLQDLIGNNAGSTGFIRNGTGISVVYNDAAGTLTITATAPKSNATNADPTTAADANAGYSAGSGWLNTATGVRWTCLDATNGAAFWFAMGAMDHPGYLSGNHYVAQRASGGASNAIADQLYAVPVYIATRVTIQALGLRVTSAIAGNARIGLYSNVASKPGAKIAEVLTPIDTGTAGPKAADLTANAIVGPGLYWLVGVFSAAPGVLQVLAADTYVGSLIGSATAIQAYGTGSNITGYTGVGTYAAGLPANFPTPTVSVAPTPLFGFQVA